MNPVTLVIIMGLGESPGGELLGLRPFAYRMAQSYGISLRFFAHDDQQLLSEILLIVGSIVLVGHSFGGYELLANIDRAFAQPGFAVNSVAGMVLLDPKPKPWWQWWNPFFEFDPPKSTVNFLNYYSGFGRPFKRGLNSRRLAIAHEKFPASGICQQAIESMIQRAMQQPATEVA